MSSNHVLYEDDISIYEKVRDKDVDVGDTIEYIPSNQQGYKSHKRRKSHKRITRRRR